MGEFVTVDGFEGIHTKFDTREEIHHGFLHRYLFSMVSFDFWESS